MATKAKNLKNVGFNYEQKENTTELISFTLAELKKFKVTPKANVLFTPKGKPFIFIENADGDKEPCSLTMKMRIELFEKHDIGYDVVKDGDGRITAVNVDDVDAAKIAMKGVKLSGSDVVFYLNEGTEGDYLTVGRPGNTDLEDMED